MENMQHSPLNNTQAGAGIDPNLAYVTSLLEGAGMTPDDVSGYLEQGGLKTGAPLQAAGDEETEAPGILDYVGDTLKGLATGAAGAVVETLNLPVDIVNLLRDDDNQFEGLDNPLKAGFAPTTAWGKGVESVTQFALGMIGAGKVLKAAKLLQGAGKAAAVGRGMTAGAIADFSVFDGNEARLSNLIRGTAFANPVTDFLASKDDDPAVLGRFKNAIEGLGLGVVGEALVVAVKGTKAARAAKNVTEAEDALIHASDELEALAVRSGQTPEQLGQSVDAVLSGDAEAVSVMSDMAGSVKEADSISEAGRSVTEAGLPHAEAMTAGLPARDAAPPPVLSPEEFGKVLDKALAKGKTAQEVFEEELLIGRALTFKTPEEANLMSAYSEKVWERTLKGQGPERHAEVLEQCPAWIESQGLKGIIEEGRNIREVMEGLTRKHLTFDMTARSLGYRVTQLGDSLRLKGLDPLKDAEWLEMQRAYQELSLISKDITTAVGRDMRARQLKTDYLPPDVMEQVLKMADNDPEKILRIQNAHRNGGTFKTITEIVTNGLLSSPKTHVVNITGNVFKTLLMPAEKMWGGRFMGDESMIREGISTYTGMRKYFTESLKMAHLAWKSGDNILDAGHKVMDGNNRTVLGTFDKVKQDILDRKIARGDTSGRLSELEELQAHCFSFLGVPSRALGAADEFFKQLNYRANVYAKLSGEAAGKFSGDAAAMARYVEDGMEAAFDKAGRGTRTDALRIAQEATWTQPLRDDAYFGGGVGQAALNMVNGYPPLRLVMPFIRTPTNLIRDFVAHTPGLNTLTKRYKDAIAAGGERKAHALGQTATGSVLWMTAATLAYSGKMTGGYPRDPAARQAWIDSGIEPYSFKIGDKFVSFARLDPFSTFFGIAADIAEYTRNWGDSARGNLAGGAVLALANNITSKSYLMGLVELMDALTDTTVDASRMEKFIQRSVTMFVPYSSGLRFTRHMADDSLREVRGNLDAILNSIPLASHLLPERYSWLTGKAVSHNLIYGENTNDLVTNELARLGNSLRVGAPSKSLGGVELDAAQYSRLCELHGTIKIGGKTLHESLTEAMRGYRYDLRREHTPDMPGGDLSNPRSLLVEEIIRDYRRRAQEQLKRESPELQEATARQWQVKVSARKGDAGRVKELLSMPG